MLNSKIEAQNDFTNIKNISHNDIWSFYHKRLRNFILIRGVSENFY